MSVNRNPRNLQLLSQLSQTNPFRDTLAPRIFAIGQDFELAVEAVGQDGRLSAQGKREKARGHLEKALRELDAAQGPIDDYRRQTKSLRSQVKAPSYDRADVVGAMNRKELRDLARSMTFGQREMRMSGAHRSVEFIDALLELEPWCSGFNVFEPNELALYNAAKESRLLDLNGELMTALEARANVEAEASMILGVVRNDLESDATDLAARAA